MSNNKPYFAPSPKQFPQRQKQPTQAPLQATTDPQYQLICTCGGELFEQGFSLYKVPGQIIGSVDLTYAQCFVCLDCARPLNIKDTKTRRELEFDEKMKEKEGA